MTDHVTPEIVAGVMTPTLQQPEKKNALTGAMRDVERVEAGRGGSVCPRDPVPGRWRQLHRGQCNDLADFASQARGESAVDSPAHRFIETTSKVARPLVAAV